MTTRQRCRAGWACALPRATRPRRRAGPLCAPRWPPATAEPSTERGDRPQPWQPAALAADAPGTLLVVVPSPADSPTLGRGHRQLSPARGPPDLRGVGSLAAPPVTRASSTRPPPRASACSRNSTVPSPPKVVVTTMAAVCQPVPERADLAARGRKIAPGEIVDPPNSPSGWSPAATSASTRSSIPASSPAAAASATSSPRHP